MSLSPVGLCGLGQMGAAVAARLATRFPVIAYDPDTARRDLVSETAGVTPVDAVDGLRAASVVVLSLPRPDVSHGVCEQLTTLLPAGSTVVETSTVLPGDAVECARILADAGIGYVDAAILSGVGQMRAGEATLLVGGQDADAQAEDVLSTLGASMERFGTTGAGMAAKVINNQVAHAVMVVLSEAVSMGAASGVELDRLVAMLSKPDGGLVRPLTHRVAERVANSDYEGGMPTDAARKDSVLALSMAQRLGIPLFATQAAHTVYDLAVAGGLGRRDYAAVATLWEQWTGVQLGG